MRDSDAPSKIMKYIEHNPMAVLSTVNDDGTPHGAVVYICGIGNQKIYFITKNLTQKYVNLIERPAVSLTIGNDKESSTLQISGRAGVVNDPNMLEIAMQKMHSVHAMMAEWLPPISKLRAGSYAIIGVTIDKARLGEFKGLAIGSRDIYTEI